MRLLHVSDLHLGRDLGGISRRDEQERLARELADAARTESADLVVIAGDVFDTSNPPAWAEDLFFGLVDELGEGGRRAVLVLSGNHDNAVRLGASRPLSSRLGVMLVSHPDEVPGAYDGGAGRVRIDPLGPGAAVVTSADGQRRVAVGALPYCSEVSLVKRAAFTAVGSETADRDAYSEALSARFHQRAALWPEGIPTLLAGHLWVSGGRQSDSERVYRVGTLSDMPASLMPAADYTALGHLHRPQQIGSGERPIVYAGSPIAYSVSEAGQQKRAVWVELEAGQPAHLRDLPLSSGRPVEVWQCRSLDEVRLRSENARALRPIVALTLHMEQPLSRIEREELASLGPAFLSVDVVLEGEPITTPTVVDRELPDDELVRAFLAEQLGVEPDEALQHELLALLQQVGADGVETEAA